MIDETDLIHLIHVHLIVLLKPWNLWNLDKRNVSDNLGILKFRFILLFSEHIEQAGAELCQAQCKLSLIGARLKLG